MATNSKSKQKQYEKNRAEKHGDRRQAWLCILYRDSAPSNYVDIINAKGWDWVEAWHDKDPDPKKPGELKKEHGHILFYSKAKIYEDEVVALVKKLNGASKVVPCKDITGSLMYFTHNTEDAKRDGKYVYDSDIIIPHGNFDLEKYLQGSRKHTKKIIEAMLDWCRENNCENYCDFVDYCRTEEPIWLDMLAYNPASLMEKYIQSKWRKNQNECKKHGGCKY